MGLLSSPVRWLHLTLFGLTIITLLFCVNYFNKNQLRSNTLPFTKFNSRLLQDNSSEGKKNEDVNTENTSTSSETSFVSFAPQQQPNLTVTNRDLTRGVAASLIYEGGHLGTAAERCADSGKKVKLVIIVTSALGHQQARQSVRESWGHFALRKDVVVAFMLGSSDNETIDRALEEEDKIYGDLIRGRFVDTYDNLTLKTISMLEWVHGNCPKASYILKTDDDMFINVDRLMGLISKRNPDLRAIYGRLAKKWKPIRNRKSKYYVSKQQYEPSVFPDFTTGPAYLFPAFLAKELYAAALEHTYFKLEDVFVTGIVANDLGIKRVHVPQFLNKKVTFTPCNVQKYVSIHMVKSIEQYALWKKVHDVAKCN